MKSSCHSSRDSLVFEFLPEATRELFHRNSIDAMDEDIMSSDGVHLAHVYLSQATSETEDAKNKSEPDQCSEGESKQRQTQTPDAAKPIDGKIASNHLDENLLQVYRNKLTILTEANTEKERRLEELEKEHNDHNVQHKEGIYWLRLQLDTTRRQKKNAEKRLAEMKKEFRKLGAGDASTSDEDDLTIGSDWDEKDILIAELRERLRKSEAGFGVMERQMATIESSSALVIKSLKEEIANIMEDRTRVELDLLNKLSDLDTERQRRQLEFALELQDRDETIDALRRGQQASLCTADATSFSGTYSDASWCVHGVSSKSRSESHADESFSNHQHHRPGGAELHRILEVASHDSEGACAGYGGGNDSGRSGELVWKERHRIDSSICKMKTVLESTNASISNMEGIVKSFDPNDDAGGENKERETMMSILQSASLISEQVKLSISLIELKLRNKSESLKSGVTVNEGHQECSSVDEKTIDTIEEIEDNALIELGKVEETLTNQLKELEERAKQELMNQNPDIKNGSLPSLGDHCHKDTRSNTDDTLVISRGVLHRLEEELVQFAECMQSKNDKIDELTAEIRKQKKRERDLKKELKAASRGTSSERSSGSKSTREHYRSRSKSGDTKSTRSKRMPEDRTKDQKVEPKNLTRTRTFSHQPIELPAELQSKKEVLQITSIKLAPDLLVPRDQSATMRRKGMPEVSLRGGTDALSPCKLTFPRHNKNLSEFFSATNQKLATVAETPLDTLEGPSRHL
ncbi:unnamed protein product [Pseudo-nitzschia multistriata]|uniref:Uncharacterized protein n=1 Tax=Pseudo-nitzschia multistriata TaxID=183589 RepID=A0A448Z216_9STRA|nr:unnamed protein product [Pseudo-nitzschia multistriata]